MVTAAELNWMRAQMEYRAKHRQMMGKVYHGSAAGTYDPTANGKGGMQERLMALAQKVAGLIDGAKVIGAVKGYDTAVKKVGREYRGDWGQIKDLARCTVVVKKQSAVKTASDLLRHHFIITEGFRIIGEKSKSGPDDTMGFSGFQMFVTSGGNKGEIQVNTPSMIYAKSHGEFLALMNEKDAKDLEKKYSELPGGLGHVLYEAHDRNSNLTPTAKAAYAAASKLYYDYFRSDWPDKSKGSRALEAMAKLTPPVLSEEWLKKANLAKPAPFRSTG
jgi:hypothetical protein